MIRDCKFPDPTQCRAMVFIRDQLRLVRGRGFRMHYSGRQCSRAPGASGYCAQHAKMAAAEDSR